MPTSCKLPAAQHACRLYSTAAYTPHPASSGINGEYRTLNVSFTDWTRHGAKRNIGMDKTCLVVSTPL